jgi:hypothetical protein
MANTMNVHLKKKDRVTVNQLLGKFRKMTTIEMEEQIDRAIEMLGEKNAGGGGEEWQPAL